MVKQKEDDILTKFTHRFNLDSDIFTIKENNFDLQYYDCSFEFKQNSAQFDIAFAEILLNSGKQRKYFRKYAIVYHNGNEYELQAFNYADRLVDNMSIKYENEIPSNPSEDARIFYKKLQNTVVFQKFIGEEIHQFIHNLENATHQEEVTSDNVYKLFYEWFSWIEFTNKDKNNISQDTLVQIFLCDILNNTVYNPKAEFAFDGKESETTTNFIYNNGVYKSQNEYYEIKSDDWRNQFWENYILPPSKDIYNYIAEHRNRLFDESYRKERGAQYTPRVLVQKQWEILTKNDLSPDSDVIWLDFACGTCNLLMDVTDKSKCYVSTIDEGDVLISKKNGFNNCMQFDFLANDSMPSFIYKGEETDILKIIKTENKPVVVVMNPPYEKKRYKKMLDKMVRKLRNFRIFYYTMGTFVEKNEIFEYKCKVIDGILSSKKAFGLKNTPVPMLLMEFGKNSKPRIQDKLTLPVFDPVPDKWDGWTLNYKKDITFKNKETFKKQIERQIREKYNPKEKQLAAMSMLGNISFFGKKDGRYKVCKSNLKECLLFAGIFFNSHTHYYDDIFHVTEKEFSKTFIADALLLAMCYKTNITTAGFSIYTESELKLPTNSLKAMPNGEMFYDFMNKYKNDLSEEGKDLRTKTLKLYHWYFKKFNINANKNVSLAELKLAIMQNTFRVSFEKTNNKISVTGMGNARVGVDCKWTPSKADRIHNTSIFMEYDRALLALQTKMYKHFIEYGIIDGMPKNVR